MFAFVTWKRLNAEILSIKLKIRLKKWESFSHTILLLLLYIYMVPFAITRNFRGPNVIFCMLHFPVWRPNHKENWLFTKKIKFCLVPADPKNEKNMFKKSWKKYENRLFSTFFWQFSTFFQKKFQHIFFNFFLDF